MVIKRKSRLSLHKQDRLVEHFLAETTARCVTSLVGVNIKTNAYYLIYSNKEQIQFTYLIKDSIITYLIMLSNP